MSVLRHRRALTSQELTPKCRSAILAATQGQRGLSQGGPRNTASCFPSVLFSYAARGPTTTNWCGQESRRHSGRLAATADWFRHSRAVRRSRLLRGRHDDRDRCLLNVLQLPKISYAALVQHAAPALTYSGHFMSAAPAPGPAVSCASSALSVCAPRAPLVLYISPTSAVSYAARAHTVNDAPAVSYAASAPAVCAAPASVVECLCPAPGV